VDCLEKALGVVKELTMKNEELESYNNELEQRIDELRRLKDDYQHLLCFFKYLVKKNGGVVQIPELAYLDPVRDLYMSYNPSSSSYIFRVNN
jgi:hypothetical protein